MTDKARIRTGQVPQMGYAESIVKMISENRVLNSAFGSIARPVSSLSSMFSLSLGALALGAAIAVSAPRWPSHQAWLEILGGGVLMCGLGLLGIGLPVFR